MSEAFTELGDAINDERFVEVDLALRRGQHIDRDDADWYAYLLDARAVLEPFYNRYACELVHRTDGYFFLLPLGDKVPKRLLGIPEMIVGQAAALLYLDPATIDRGGVLTKDDILSHLAAVMGTDALVLAFNPKRKRMDERVAQETVRQRTTEALRKLAQLGFVSQLEDGQIRLRGALMRFADPVRGAGSPRDALEKLIARGEVAMPEEAAAETESDDTQDSPYDDDTDASIAHPPGYRAKEKTAEPLALRDEVPEPPDNDEPSDLELEQDPSGQAPFTYDSEFPLEPEGRAEDHEDEDNYEDDYERDDIEESDSGEPLGHDDAGAQSVDGNSHKRRTASKATTTSAEWDPTFDDFD